MNKIYIIGVLFSLLLISCGSDDETVLGCMDTNALNYNSDAVEEDGSCEYTLFSGPDAIEEDPSKINRKVLVVGIDGFRSDAMIEQITPFMLSLIHI